MNFYCKLPTLSDNHFAPDLRDRRPSSPRPRSGARFCTCFSLPTFATGGVELSRNAECAPICCRLRSGAYGIIVLAGSLAYPFSVSGPHNGTITPMVNGGYSTLRMLAKPAKWSELDRTFTLKCIFNTPFI
eukprot:COSAG06_NODE_4000_length_4674_cov_6.128087_2_plen_131_part_00